MEVRSGYKQTEAGVIPEYWETAPLGHIGQWFSGGTPSLSNASYWSGDIPWVSPKDMKRPRLSDAIDHISQKAITDGARVLPVGAILMVIRGMILAHSFPVARVERPLAFNQDIKAVVPRADVDSNFVLYWLMANKQRLRSLITESTHGTKRLPSEALLRAAFCLPPISEQRAIATTLSDVDALLAKLDQLIAKKRDLKQATMQQLLTGQTRLPGFSGEWEVRSLRAIVSTPVTDGPHSTPKFLDDGIPFLSVNNLVGNKIDFDDLRYVSRDDHEVFSRKCKPQCGDILLGKAASVGKVAIVDTDVEFNIWSPIALVRVGGGNIPRFVFYQLQGAALVRQIVLLTNSSSQGNIGMGDIEKLAIQLPSAEEQAAIATVLSDMDAELTALEARRDKTHALKQGMMQELLTGRIRLV